MEDRVSSGLSRPTRLPGGLHYQSMSLCLNGATFSYYIFQNSTTRVHSTFISQYVALKIRKDEKSRQCVFVCVSEGS